LVVEGSSEFVQAGNALATNGDKGIDGDDENAGSLVQARLRVAILILPECLDHQRWEKEKAGRRICPPLVRPESFSRGTSLSI
jgi:hypothetical protein